MKCLITRILLTALLILSAGCSSFIQKPQVSLKETVINGVDSNGVDVECHLSISNPNSFDLALLGYSYKLQLISTPLLTGNSSETLLVPAEKEAVMRLPVRISFKTFIELIGNQPDPAHLPYRLEAELTLKSPIGTVTIPIEKSDSLFIPEKYRPAYYLKQLRNLLNPPAD